ncbi:MAG: DUF1552 domain-containing protein [Planctomycetaceae bacterium]|nr:DUF1552 domain-containing protein [Planctomycetales bacterium]MCB9922160.1 DUF1552 domain-containing protein [Planctomycetaceae bacterium]
MLQQRSTPCSRRGFLQGAGISLALPWLESLPVRAADTGKLATPSDVSKPPIRFACIYFSNGVEPIHWWARGRGSSMEVGPGLQPLLAHREDIVFLRGLFNEQAVKNSSAHLGRMPNLLSGAWVSLDQNDIRVGQTMDQVLAQQIGHHTAVPSLALGIEPTELRLEDGLSMIYGSSISWASATKPATKEIYPARVFDLLVGDGRGRRLDRSILDQVLSDAQHLRRVIGNGDRQKLDEYLESIRDVEQRINRASREERLEGWKPTLSQPNMRRPQDELPQDVPDHMRLILDLVVLAFQMDKTRIATCMLNNDLSQMNFGFLDGVQGSLHLDLTHNGRDPELEAMYLKTNQFHVEQFAYLLKRMKAIDEGGQSMLDYSILMCCSNLFDGDKHQADQMPIVLAGRGGGSLETGRVLNYLDRGDDNRRACSLYLSLMDRMAVHLPRFGDTDRRLADL